MKIGSLELSQFFKFIKRPKYILGTTYTLSLAFFESVILPLIDRSNLKSCLIISDSNGYQRAIDEAPALQKAAQDYLIVKALTPGCFHAKVWLIIGETEFAILVGSGNLTQTGFMTNAELFDVLHFSEDAPLTSNILEDLISFISGLSKMWDQEDSKNLLCLETLSTIEDALGSFRKKVALNDSGIRFLHSFNKPLIEQLPELPGCESLFVASPFFGGDIKGVELLMDKYNSPHLHLFPAIHSGNFVDIPIDAVKRNHDNCVVASLDVSPKNESFAHLKLYGINSTNKKAWLFCTSANCTAAAWNGNNIEAGIIRPVLQEEMDSYFIASDSPLPTTQLFHEYDHGTCAILDMWAVDTGSSIELTILSSSNKFLPLTDIQLVIRTGSHIVECKKSLLFENKTHEKLLLADFENWERKNYMASSLKISAKDNGGITIMGSCFIENHLLLTAEPIHRSAWRGALALLQNDVMPDLADIAAIFSLVDGLFTGTLFIRQPSVPIKKDTTEKNLVDNSTIHIALWPPQPDQHMLHRYIGTTGSGQLHWCQKILETFLKPEIHPEKEIGSTIFDPDKGSEEKNAKKPQQENYKRAKKAAENIWDIGWKNYCNLKDKLQKAVPTSETAHNIWPIAIFSFLATISIYRAAKRIYNDIESEVQFTDIADGFMRLLLDDRRQPPDYCCPQFIIYQGKEVKFRYKYTPFPSLADDLKNKFNISPNTDLAIVMLSLLIDYKMRKDPDCKFPVSIWRRNLKQIIPSEMQLDVNIQEACIRIWHIYLNLGTTENDHNFNSSFQFFLGLQD